MPSIRRKNRFGSLISVFGLSAILKHCTGKHAHYLGLAAAAAWSREKQMSVALGKKFDMKQEENPTATRVKAVVTQFRNFRS